MHSIAKTTWFYNLIIVLLLTISACNAPPPATLSTTSSVTPVPILPTALPTTVQPQATNTPQPTATPLPTNTAQPTFTPQPVTPQPIATVPGGLGVTRADAARPYQILEFAFNEKENGQYVGTISDNLAVVTLTGPNESITSASVVINVPKPPTKNQSSRTVIYLATLHIVAAKDWPEATDWLNQSLNTMGESKTTWNGREIILVITPQDTQTVVEFSISIK